MKKIAFFAIVCFTLSFLIIPAEANAVTQGDFALALAQVLGMEVTTIDLAVSSLEDVKIQPDDGWIKPDPMTDEIIAQLEQAIEKAVRAGLIKRRIAEGAIAAAASATDMRIAVAEPAGREVVVPWYAPIAGPPADGPTERSPFLP